MKQKDTFKFYDEGWRARYYNESFNRKATLDWRDGWKDCDEISEKERREIGPEI